MTIRPGTCQMNGSGEWCPFRCAGAHPSAECCEFCEPGVHCGCCAATGATVTPMRVVPICARCGHQIHPTVVGPGMVIGRCAHDCSCYEDGCREEVFA